MKPQDAQKVRDGNTFARISVSLALIAVLKHIPGSLENPCASRLFGMPSLRHLRRRKHVSETNLFVCAFGSRFRKRTNIFHWHGRFSDLARTCSSKQSVCDYTGKKHQLLRGTNPETNTFWTQTAEPYPPKLCVSWANTFCNARAGVIVNNMRAFGC